MKKKFHYVGRGDDNAAHFEECGGDLRGIVKPLEHGKPIPPGQVVGKISSTKDGHYEIEVDEADGGMDTSAGPSKAVNDAYRSGWDRIFGDDSKELN